MPGKTIHRTLKLRNTGFEMPFKELLSKGSKGFCAYKVHFSCKIEQNVVIYCNGGRTSLQYSVDFEEMRSQICDFYNNTSHGLPGMNIQLLLPEESL